MLRKTFLLKCALLFQIFTVSTSTQTPGTPSSVLISSLRSQLKLAGSLLSKSPTLPTPVHCMCEDYCSGRCFAPGCLPCPPNMFDREKDLCLASGPFGTGLLCHKEKPCCETDNGNSTAACIVVDGPCECSSYNPEPDLFPLPPGRSYTFEGKCVTGNYTSIS